MTAPAAARQLPAGAVLPASRTTRRSSPLVTRRTGKLAVTRLQMEGLALTGAWVDKDAGLLSLIVLEMGGSSRLCASLQPGRAGGGDGADRHAHRDPGAESVVLCGGGLGNAVLFSIAKALRAVGSRVLYFAAYRKKEDIYKVEEIEAAPTR